MPIAYHRPQGSSSAHGSDWLLSLVITPLLPEWKPNWPLGLNRGFPASVSGLDRPVDTCRHQAIHQHRLGDVFELVLTGLLDDVIALDPLSCLSAYRESGFIDVLPLLQ